MNQNHVIDSWIAELRLAPRRLRRRQQEGAVAVAATEAGARRKKAPPRDGYGYPSIPAVAIQAATER
jgi:hypothetical protein